MGIVLHLNRLGPTVISDVGLITRIGFATLPKFYTELFQYSMRTSPFRSTTYSLRCKIEKFEAILFPCRSRRHCLCPADRRAPVPEAGAVHPKCNKLSSGAHTWPSRAKADTPRCSAISPSYCRRPRPTSCTPSRCRRPRHLHCLSIARWRIDTPLHHAHPRRHAGDHGIPCV
jgi:hypothetical protein